MFCKKCGKELVEGNSFCGSCGAPVVKREEKKEEMIEEPKLSSDLPAEEKADSLVDFLSNEKEVEVHHERPEENSLENLLETPKTNVGVSDEGSIQLDEAKDNLVDLVVEEKPKVTPKTIEETEEDNVFTREDNSQNNVVSFNENPKKQSPVVTIILGIVGFVAGYIVVSMLFGNNPLNMFRKNNTPANKKTTPTNIVEKYEQKQLGELKYEIPNTFSVYQDKPQYIIYTTEDEICMISVATTPLANQASPEALIESSLNASKESINGTMTPYTPSKREYNSIEWTHASTMISGQGVNLYYNSYAVAKNGNYYAMIFQSQGYSTDCTSYQAKIIRTAKFD